jgi:acylphosphatase
MTAARFLISGHVQGVGFRDATRREAERLGLSGTADNLPDGRVVVDAFGNPHALGTLQTWLHQGPRWARVDQVERRALEGTAPSAFGTGWRSAI